MADGVVLGQVAIEQIKQLIRDFYAQVDPSWQLGNVQNQEIRKPIVHGVTDAAVSTGGTVTVSVYKGTMQNPNSYTLTDTGENIQAYSRFGPVPSGRPVLCQRFLHGWEIIQARCGT